MEERDEKPHVTGVRVKLAFAAFSPVLKSRRSPFRSTLEVYHWDCRRTRHTFQVNMQQNTEPREFYRAVGGHVTCCCRS